MLRLKLMTAPVRQDWMELSVVTVETPHTIGSGLSVGLGSGFASLGASGFGSGFGGVNRVTDRHTDSVNKPAGTPGGDGRGGSSARSKEKVRVPWTRYYVRLFRNKKLVCWESEVAAKADASPARVIDLFDVLRVEYLGAGSSGAECAASGVGSQADATGAPVNSPTIGSIRISDEESMPSPSLVHPHTGMPAKHSKVDGRGGRQTRGIVLELVTKRGEMVRLRFARSTVASTPSSQAPIARRAVLSTSAAVSGLVGGRSVRAAGAGASACNAAPAAAAKGDCRAAAAAAAPDSSPGPSLVAASGAANATSPASSQQASLTPGCAPLAVRRVPSWASRQIALRALQLRAMHQRAAAWLSTLRAMLDEIAAPEQVPAFVSVRLWVGTWNMGNAPPELEQLKDWLGLADATHDIYVIGMQEAHFSLPSKTLTVPRVGSAAANSSGAFIASAILTALGPSYRLVDLRSMWSIRLLIVAHEEVEPHVELLASDAEATGIGGVGGNKGGVAAALSLHGTTNVAFICAHLAAHQDMVRRRNRDAQDILRGLRSLAARGLPGASKHLDPTLSFHHVFFFGDLNYRIDQGIEPVILALQHAAEAADGAARAAAEARSAEMRAAGGSDDSSAGKQDNSPPLATLAEPTARAAAVVRAAEARTRCATFSAEAERILQRLYEYDQLRAERAAGRLLYGFTEVRPRFMPTFKRLRAAATPVPAANDADSPAADGMSAGASSPKARLSPNKCTPPKSPSSKLTAKAIAQVPASSSGDDLASRLRDAIGFPFCSASPAEPMRSRPPPTSSEASAGTVDLSASSASLHVPHVVLPTASAVDYLSRHRPCTPSHLLHRSLSSRGLEDPDVEAEAEALEEASLQLARGRVLAEVKALHVSQPNTQRSSLFGRFGGHARQGSWGAARATSNIDLGPDARIGERRVVAEEELPQQPFSASRRSRRAGACAGVAAGVAAGAAGAAAAGGMAAAAALLRGTSLANIPLTGVVGGASPPPTPTGPESERAAAAALLADRCNALRYKANRVPAWCDRVLWRSYPSLTPLLSQTSYVSHPSVVTSDHTPVSATFELRVLLPSDGGVDETSAFHLHEWEMVAEGLELFVPLASLDEDDAAAARLAPPDLLLEFSGSFIRTGYASPTLTATLARRPSKVDATLIPTLGSATNNTRGLPPLAKDEGTAAGRHFLRGRNSRGKQGGGALTDTSPQVLIGGLGSGRASERGGGHSELALRAAWPSAVYLPVTDASMSCTPSRMALEHLVVQAVALFGTRRVTLGGAVFSMDASIGAGRVVRTRTLVSCGSDTGGTITVGTWLKDLAGRHDPHATAPFSPAASFGGSAAPQALAEASRATEPTPGTLRRRMSTAVATVRHRSKSIANFETATHHCSPQSTSPGISQKAGRCPRPHGFVSSASFNIRQRSQLVRDRSAPPLRSGSANARAPSQGKPCFSPNASLIGDLILHRLQGAKGGGDVSAQSPSSQPRLQPASTTPPRVAGLLANIRLQKANTTTNPARADAASPAATMDTAEPSECKKAALATPNRVRQTLDLLAVDTSEGRGPLRRMQSRVAARSSSSNEMEDRLSEPASCTSEDAASANSSVSNLVSLQVATSGNGYAIRSRTGSSFSGFI